MACVCCILSTLLAHNSGFTTTTTLVPGKRPSSESLDAALRRGQQVVEAPDSQKPPEFGSAAWVRALTEAKKSCVSVGCVAAINSCIAKFAEGE